MLVIRKKIDISKLMMQFADFAQFDHEKEKYYFVFEDRKRNGQWTLMNKDGEWTIHGKGEHYSDIDEKRLSEEDVLSFVWGNRGAVNEVIKARE
ncbi:MAG TPA: hypothetical protein GX525_09280 [Bacilli bacterium]|nr:hypothetical protein [Bacilli bacterium]